MREGSGAAVISMGAAATGCGAGIAWTKTSCVTDGGGAENIFPRCGARGRVRIAASTAHQAAHRVAALILTPMRGRNRRAAHTNSAIAALCHRLFSKDAKTVPRMFWLISPAPPRLIYESASTLVHLIPRPPED